jgi:cell fate regulator YaaT (PSP1 superfamily)
MAKVWYLCFRRSGKLYPYLSDLDFKPGDWAVAESLRGEELSLLIKGEDYSDNDPRLANLKTIKRKATHKDIEQFKENNAKALEALKICQEKIKAHNLPMKLIKAEYMLDGGKIIFSFTAAGRVDFRNLVRDLAGVFKKRIELHQIGVRDAAKLIGGLGPCGKTMCCIDFLREFEPVSIKMAKDQNLTLNPSKISGTCSRLMCCLNYEHQTYLELSKSLPCLGSEVIMPDGMTGIVVDLNIPKQTVVVQLPSNVKVEKLAAELEVSDKPPVAVEVPKLEEEPEIQFEELLEEEQVIESNGNEESPQS